MIDSTFQTGQKLSLSRLKSFRWKNPNVLRGWMDPTEIKEHNFGMLFLQHLSDTFDEAKEDCIKYYLSQGKTQQEAEIKIIMERYMDLAKVKFKRRVSNQLEGYVGLQP